ncbi:TIGR02452 family protein [Streptomyces sp. 1331.2]|uniref:TIGR02452 family protein n=1 Tax=Streptomyces sp. 1331.2 TaxID=1938835 RepID=UPI000BCEA2F9|nr:TIGR02452 family protein [Streptomyces sp. 1331.2]SOB82738.1 TIGR02452 family protein [Streptomyces sp. 1331.2]
MSSRLHDVARVNEEIAGRGSYRTAGGELVQVGEQLTAARAGTVSYPPQALDALVAAGEPGPGPKAGAEAGAGVGSSGVVEVTAEGSIEAARRLVAAGAGPVGVLNFASARNPGGGYLRGARAQEEDLCRSALLYSCLVEAPDYYEAHRASTDLRYSHRVIVSPDVPVIRDGRGELLAQPYPVTFLTSPAPNAGQLERRSPGTDVRGVLAERAVRVLAAAARHEVRTLVLGAWGCGVFGNDPAQVAEAFEGALARYGAAFERVVFAVWDRTPVSPNRAAFEARFGTAAGAGR